MHRREAGEIIQRTYRRKEREKRERGEREKRERGEREKRESGKGEGRTERRRKE